MTMIEYYSHTRYWGWVRRLSYELAERLWQNKPRRNPARLVWRYWAMKKGDDGAFYFGPRGGGRSVPVDLSAKNHVVSLDKDNIATIHSVPDCIFSLLRISQIVGADIRSMRGLFRKHIHKTRMMHNGRWVPFVAGMKFNTLTGQLLTPELLHDPALHINRTRAAALRRHCAQLKEATWVSLRLDNPNRWDPLCTEEVRQGLLALEGPHAVGPTELILGLRLAWCSMRHWSKMRRLFFPYEGSNEGVPTGEVFDEFFNLAVGELYQFTGVLDEVTADSRKPWERTNSSAAQH